jgi:hypothetical protein
MRHGGSAPFAMLLAALLLSLPGPTRGSLASPPETPGTTGASPPPPAAVAAAPQSPAAVAGCKLFQPGAREAPSSDCTGCHSAGHGASTMGSSHPVEIEYGPAQARGPNGLRQAAEVARRGIPLPKGKVECVTCHDAASPWAKRIALPRGAPAIPRTDPERRPNWRLVDPRTPPPPPGSEVISAPLCAACHTAAD